MANQIRVSVAGQATDVDNFPLAGADAQVYMATMEPSGNPVILNAADTTDDQGNFVAVFHPLYGSDIYSVWAAIFDPLNQTKGSGYLADQGSGASDGDVIAMGIVNLK